MTNPLGYSIAILATTSFVLAGGEGEKKGGDKAAKNTSAPSVLEKQWFTGSPLISFQGDNHSMNISTGVQTRVSFTDRDGGTDQTNVEVRTARSSMSGHAYDKNLTYMVSNEWTEGTSIKEGWLNYQFHSTDATTAAVRVGQGKTGFGREWNTEWSDLEFLDRSAASQAFANTRTRGVTVHGTHAGSGINWGIAMHNNATDGLGGGEESDNDNNEMDYTFNLSWSNNRKAVRMGGTEGALDGEGGFGLGIAHTLSNADGAAGASDAEDDATNMWASWKGGNLAANIEIFAGTDNLENGGTDSDSDGVAASLSWTASKVADQAQWGVGLRFSSVEDVAGADDVETIELILNRYSHGHGMKSQFGVVHTSTDGAGGTTDDYLVALQTTVVF